MLNQFNPLKRRQFLDRLTLATLGVTTSSSLAEKIVGPTPSNKKLIFLYMDGGMSHLDTFDPHPGTDEAGPSGPSTGVVHQTVWRPALPCSVCVTTRNASHTHPGAWTKD